MFELRRITSQFEVKYCDATGNAILPWEWYWYDPQTGYNYNTDIVYKWKQKALKKSLQDAQIELKMYEIGLKQEKNIKKGTVKQRELEYMQKVIEDNSGVVEGE